MPQYGWHVNIDNCIACRACEAACKQEYLLPAGVRRRLVVIQEGTGPSGRPYRRHITSACNHCADPACVAACPVQRYWKDDASNAALRTAFGMTDPETGLVLVKPTTAEDPVNGVDCIGCKRCQAACPYGAPQWDEAANVMDKCTGCYHRLYNPDLPVERRMPACALTCTALALAFDDMTVITGGAYGPADTTTGAPAGAKEIASPSYTTPSIRFAPQTNIT
ncbi:MAG: 4Fe-4S dicluster domain-containing protein [Myxococcales bacterium]|nr:4Fe-4S dicluster domain-containing protein [Myxococcales bacterium]